MTTRRLSADHFGLPQKLPCSVIRFSQDDRHYLPLVFTRWEGLECMNYSSFVYAYRQENIATVIPMPIFDPFAEADKRW